MARNREEKEIRELVTICESAQSVTLENGRTTFIKRGDYGPNLILLSGWPFRIDPLTPLQKELADQFQTYSVNLPGLGSDPLKSECSYKGLSSWLRNFMDATGIDRSSIVGISFGGAIAVKFGRFFPEMVDHVVASSPPINMIEAIDEWQRQLYYLFHKIPGLIPLLVRKLTQGNPLVHYMAWKDFPNMQDDFGQYVQQKFRSIDPREASKYLDLLLNADITKDLADLPPQYRIIIGAKDTLFLSQAQKVSTRHNFSYEVFPGASHIDLVWNRPQDLANKIKEFIATSS